MSEHLGSEVEAPVASDGARPEGSGDRELLLQAFGGLLMVAGIVVAIVAYIVASGQNSGDLTIDNLEHNEHTILAICGLTVAVVGASLFSVFGVTRALRRR